MNGRADTVRKTRTRRGAALLAVLVLCLVLLVMVKALVMMAHSGSFQSRQHYARVAGLYAAEAALTEVRTRLAAEPDWVAGFDDVQMSDMPATYTVRFNVTGKEVGPDESVNNLSCKDPADGPRGEGTVPPYTAEIVVTTRVHGYTRRLSVLLTPGGGGQAYPYALASSGRVLMSGNVAIDGVHSLQDSTAVEAGLHSNRGGAEADIVTWKPLSPGDRAEISGQVSTCATSKSAIDFGGDPAAYSVGGGFQTGAASRPAPVGDILAEIAGASALPPPSIEPLGTTTLSSQRYYCEGDLKVNGDLILQDASLYVRGNLLVNGTVAGTGSVYVAGDTSFQGDARVRTGEAGVALYSKGNVHLSGFSGDQFLAALASQDPVAANYYDQVQGGLETMLGWYTQHMHEQWGVNLGKSLAGEPSVRSMGVVTVNRGHRAVKVEPDALGKLVDRIDALPPGSTKDFLTGKLRSLKVALERGDRQSVLDHTLNKLGSAYFQGVVYTNGHVWAANDLEVMGAIWAQDDGSGQPALIDGTVVEPGDVVLRNGLHLTLDEEYVKARWGEIAGARVGGGVAPEVRAWMEP